MARPASERRSNVLNVAGMSLDELGRSTEPLLLHMVASVLTRTSDPHSFARRREENQANNPNC